MKLFCSKYQKIIIEIEAVNFLKFNVILVNELLLNNVCGPEKATTNDNTYN